MAAAELENKSIKQLKKLQSVDWKKSNHVWEGKAMIGGRLSKALMNVILTTIYLKHVLELPLTSSEGIIEKRHLTEKIVESEST